jgi:hypothetical protein
MSFPMAFFETIPIKAFVAPVKDVAAYGGGFFVKPGSRTLKPADLTKPFMFEWATLGLKMANGATKKAPDMSIFKAATIHDFAVKKQIVSSASDSDKKALINAFGSMKLPLNAEEMAELEKKVGLVKTVEKRARKAINLEEEKEIADYIASHKDEAKAMKQAGLKAIRDKWKPTKGGAVAADTVDTASEAELSDAEVEVKQEDVEKVAEALKKFHGEVGEPPYHIEKVKAELEKATTNNLKDIARELKLRGKISKKNKSALIALITNFMETD